MSWPAARGVNRSFRTLRAQEKSRSAHCAPVAQLDRALVSGTRGRAFESPQARHIFQEIS